MFSGARGAGCGRDVNSVEGGVSSFVGTVATNEQEMQPWKNNTSISRPGGRVVQALIHIDACTGDGFWYVQIEMKSRTCLYPPFPSRTEFSYFVFE